jgi:hypothetical protein
MCIFVVGSTLQTAAVDFAMLIVSRFIGTACLIDAARVDPYPLSEVDALTLDSEGRCVILDFFQAKSQTTNGLGNSTDADSLIQPVNVLCNQRL